MNSRAPIESRLSLSLPAGLLLTLPVLLAGCGGMPTELRRWAPAQGVGNVYRSDATAPSSMRRVVLLPLVPNSDSPDQKAGIQSLQSVLVSELAKSGTFDISMISPLALQVLTGSSNWTADDALPKDFLARLQGATGCDGIVFVTLTDYEAYPPLRIGWKARLVDCRDGRTCWAADEIFDAGSPMIAKAAQAYARAEAKPPTSFLCGREILYSPREFGQFTASALVRSMPKR